MPPVSRLGKQIAELIAALNAIGVRFALIGGLALASYKVVRATQDIDLLVDADRANEIEAELVKLGYRCLHRSADAANYARDDERLDFIYAHRRIARELLAASEEQKTLLGDLRVVSAEGLIGFKLQGVVNDPRRTQDLEDIRSKIPESDSIINIAAAPCACCNASAGVRPHAAGYARAPARVALARPVRGPLALGFACHFGLGLLAPAPDA